MPKQIVEKLGIEYDPLEKGVVQWDGTAIKIVGVIKNLSLTLHTCPNFSIPQEVYVIELPPYFVICLSLDFTTKIGGYLSFDWSHMLFRTRYGTKVTIKSEPVAKNHIEPYNLSVVNATTVVNCALFDQEDITTANETTT